ncbi:hypothetical protein Pcinc_000442 [Petrolisthes cinctipes]|uniref:Neurotrophin-3 n=1 Tax=Petrolisthes cinctipes TaxID=88211 RepID=A0AAE1GNI8_PETCI|nr:hypothetical protein Pcinc_000442 [Petrolisthes cinctipes]
MALTINFVSVMLVRIVIVSGRNTVMFSEHSVDLERSVELELEHKVEVEVERLLKKFIDNLHLYMDKTTTETMEVENSGNSNKGSHSQVQDKRMTLSMKGKITTKSRERPLDAVTIQALKNMEEFAQSIIHENYTTDEEVSIRYSSKINTTFPQYNREDVEPFSHNVTKEGKAFLQAKGHPVRPSKRRKRTNKPPPTIYRRQRPPQQCSSDGSSALFGGSNAMTYGSPLSLSSSTKRVRKWLSALESCWSVSLG